MNKLVFDGGEEFELVFTVTPKNLKKIHALAKKNKINIFEIGHVSKGKGVFFDDGDNSYKIKDKDGNILDNLRAFFYKAKKICKIYVRSC